MMSISLPGRLSPRDRAEHSRPAHAARAQIGFEPTQGLKGFVTVHG
jgi:hypothetical protein